jgi:hypothetical protein
MSKGTILNWPDNVSSLCVSCQKHMCIQVRTCPIYDQDNWQISPEMDHWKSHPKVLHFMQDNKADMLIKKDVW